MRMSKGCHNGKRKRKTDGWENGRMDDPVAGACQLANP